MKRRFDLEVQESREHTGGWLMTTEALTDKQVIAQCKRIGFDFLMNNDCNDYGVMASTEDEELHFIVHVSKHFTKKSRWRCEYLVWDCDKECFIEDTETERYEQEKARFDAKMAAANEKYGISTNC